MNDRIDLEQVREIVRLAEESGLAELEVESPTLKVRVRRSTPGAVAPATVQVAGASHPAGAPAPAASAERGLDHLEPVIAPMVGTFYRSPSPDAPPFISEGDFVEPGQVVCIIEAMKLFNEIVAEKAGRIARVLVENASPVEYGQPLFLLDTSASRG
ncbi:MAG: acetyl-CoA carboxylase biotin carboxyl carrier protein [Armatimonadota bacterium]|nr:acetyl-CoA carboxylase biotin carboxyl carrier protein [Armatimonadota bacterium]